MQINLRNALFTLLPQKAMYKEDEGLLIIADVHLGKASHFRKSGIAIPVIAQSADYENLKRLFERVRPQKVYFLGDLFHSSFNGDWHYFAELIVQFSDIAFTLVKGNHDVINSKLFEALNIKVADEIADESFVYCHIPPEQGNGKLNISGHVHPGVRLSGIGRQSVALPCFYHLGDNFILPAFGVLTGLYFVPVSNDASVYLVLADEVRKL